MLKYLACSSALALLLAGGAFAEEGHHEEGHDHENVTLYRVFVGDHEAAKVTAFDLGDPDHRWTFETTGQNKLYSVDNGSAIVAVQSFDDAVHFITSGISLHAHGDHSDIEISDPAFIEASLTGPRPFHIIDHDGEVAINFDRGGYVEVVDAHELSEGELETFRIPQARAHHGYAAPIGEFWVTSVASDAPVEGDAAPERIGLQAINADGTPAGDVATCTAIHGEAFSGAYLATAFIHTSPSRKAAQFSVPKSDRGLLGGKNKTSPSTCTARPGPRHSRRTHSRAAGTGSWSCTHSHVGTVSQGPVKREVLSYCYLKGVIKNFFVDDLRDC